MAIFIAALFSFFCTRYIEKDLVSAKI
jgi:hypothetical protein